VTRSITIVALAAALTSAPALSQGPKAGSGARFGITVGGISTVGVVFEYYKNARGLELGFGTWSFRDLSVSAVAKQYFGAGAAQPFLGAGLWAIAAAPSGDERLGIALVLRAPIGVDWGLTDDHSLGAALSVNRGLAVRRSDPEDDLPLNKRLVPLPELYYRFTR
jgi:hypothetical protein